MRYKLSFDEKVDYRLGLRNVHDRLPVYPNATNATARNYTLNISVGYNFR